MDSEYKLMNLIKDLVKSNNFGLFCYKLEDLSSIKYISDFNYQDEDMADQIISLLKNAPFREYLLIQKKNNKTIYVQIENNLFSLAKEITENKEKIIFYHKVISKNDSPLSVSEQMKNLLKKIA